MGDHQGFTVVLRGYDTAEVDAMLERIRAARVSLDGADRSALRQELTSRTFLVRLRGYDRAQVDEYLRRALDRLV
jgi:DivIVA domain-containing protein